MPMTDRRIGDFKLRLSKLQERLEELARDSAQSLYRRMEAVGRMTDQSRLTQLATDENVNLSIAAAAIDRITDPVVLEAVASSAKRRADAAGNLYSMHAQRNLVVALHAQDAVRRKQTLTRLAEDASDPVGVRAEIERISDRQLLDALATCPNPTASAAATARLKQLFGCPRCGSLKWGGWPTEGDRECPDCHYWVHSSPLRV